MSIATFCRLITVNDSYECPSRIHFILYILYLQDRTFLDRQNELLGYTPLTQPQQLGAYSHYPPSSFQQISLPYQSKELFSLQKYLVPANTTVCSSHIPYVQPPIIIIMSIKIKSSQPKFNMSKQICFQSEIIVNPTADELWSDTCACSQDTSDSPW